MHSHYQPNPANNWIIVEAGVVTFNGSDCLEKENVSALDDHTISINLESYRGESALSLAYLWRETPVKEYLGLPIYGLEPFHLPSPPWKKTLPIN